MRSIKVTRSKNPETPTWHFLTASILLLRCPAQFIEAGERELERWGLKGVDVTIKLFSACVFLLTQIHLDDITLAIVDNEYQGHSKDIERDILKLIWTVKPDFERERIETRKITKKSPAHKKAWKTQKGITKPNKKIKAKELMSVLGVLLK